MMPPFRTVLIDDHRVFSDGLNLILSHSPDFTVVEQVFDSRRAYDACLQQKPDLVLVDYNMPHLDGVAVVKQLGQLTHTCRIVVISLYADKEEIARCRALKVDGYLAKTIPADRLLALLGRVMQGEQVIETDLPNETPGSLPDHWRLGPRLTKREVDILMGMKQGLTTEQIAVQLELSYFTVQIHRKNISRKLPFLTEKELYEFLEVLADSGLTSDR